MATKPNVTVSINPADNSLTIQCEKYGKGKYGDTELLDDLGDEDVVTANEIETGYIICAERVYDFGNGQQKELELTNTVTLANLGSLEDFKDENPDFYNWFHGITEGE